MKSFGPETIVPKSERDDCMENVLQEAVQGEVLTVENLNRMNDAFAKPFPHFVKLPVFLQEKPE